jgi:uncharacterized radical SAM protein YgiQ
VEHAFKTTDWLPTSVKEAKLRGWETPDVVLFSGDAYVDHPAFGSAVVGRLIEKEGLKVVIVPQPNWRDDLRDFKKFGRPNLFFGVTSGCMDSMVSHYTANKRLRSNDAYTPDGKAGYRPDYATIVYSKILKELYPDVPVLLGGIEASLRRVTHYDYWKDELFPTILSLSNADMLVYGMGEQPLVEIIGQLKKGIPFSKLNSIPQTAYLVAENDGLPKIDNWTDLELFSHDECLKDKKKYARNFRSIEEESNKWEARRLVQRVGDKLNVINPPYPPMTENELDASFDLPYTRLPHPRYHKKGPIPAFEMIKFSINMHRGCFGGCSFCTISAHQGKFIASRSKESILKEAAQVTKMPDFKGYISDLGGPSANMYGMKGKVLDLCRQCKRPSCIFPKVCKNLDTDHTPMLDIYNSVDKLPGVKKSFVGSGIRFDMLVNDSAPAQERESHNKYIKELIEKHVSGRLKVAPEHTSDKVLEIMRKPSFSFFHKFHKQFNEINEKSGLRQQLIPYFISSHPGSNVEDMANLAVEAKGFEFKLEQVQDFTPTPMTVATVIYYSGYHPYTMEKVYTARSKDEKLNQRMFFFWYKPEYKQAIRNQLEKIGRFDLISKLLPGNQRKMKVEKSVGTNNEQHVYKHIRRRR